MKSANRMLGMINRTFVSKDSAILLRLYQSLVRAKLEYCVQAWRQHLRNDIDLLEKVQKRATKLMVRDKSLSYYQRLKKVCLTSLETRRVRGDFIEVFKIFKGFDNVNYSQFFSLSSTGLRGHEFKRQKPQIHLDIRKHFFHLESLKNGTAFRKQLLTATQWDTLKKLDKQ